MESSHLDIHQCIQDLIKKCVYILFLKQNTYIWCLSQGGAKYLMAIIHAYSVGSNMEH